MKMKQEKVEYKNRGTLLYWFIAIFLIALLAQLSGCKKVNEIKPAALPVRITSSYQLNVDSYSLDTTIFLSRAIWWKDTLSDPVQKQKVDTLPDMWFVMCATYSVPSHLEHQYYIRDGKKINQSKFPFDLK